MTAHIGYSFCYDIAVWRQLAMRGGVPAAPFPLLEFRRILEFLRSLHCAPVGYCLLNLKRNDIINGKDNKLLASADYALSVQPGGIVEIVERRKGSESHMKSKYNMTLEQNIFVAKRNIVDYIYKSARLEGLGVTYPDTEAIFNGIAF
jgi:hypothetical protein